ncbi:hypothetical protein NAS141_01341 [Sulfitobacter sp. NAS-14.1]|nr:hypothetical protein NAS141_01341 [Sulfitobacter sp. NAS-14.1]
MGKVLTQKGSEMFGKVGHLDTPLWNASLAAAMCAISSGVTSRYQYVSVTWACPK